MNQMRIPKLMRASIWITLPVFVLSLAAALMSGSVKYPQIKQGAEILIGVSLFLMLAWPLSTTFDLTLNALVRRFGKPGKATVIARHNTGISMGKMSHLWRVKLHVQPAEGEAFEAITEDQGSGGEVGEKVTVRYDPLTKSVAIMRPWDFPAKRADQDVNF